MYTLRQALKTFATLTRKRQDSWSRLRALERLRRGSVICHLDHVMAIGDFMPGSIDVTCGQHVEAESILWEPTSSAIAKVWTRWGSVCVCAFESGCGFMPVRGTLAPGDRAL